MKACFKHWWMVAIGLALLPASLRAEFVYVVDFHFNDISAYRIAANGALTFVGDFPTGGVALPIFEGGESGSRVHNGGPRVRLRDIHGG
jgi:hypothetical protein